MESNSGFSVGGIGKELEWNNIDSYRYRRKDSLLIQRLYLWIGIEKEEKTEDFTHIVLLIEKEIWFISYPSLNEKMGQILQDQTHAMGLKEWWKGIKKEIEKEKKSKQERETK